MQTEQARRTYMPPAVVALRLTETPQVAHLLREAVAYNDGPLIAATWRACNLADRLNGIIAGLLYPDDEGPRTIGGEGPSGLPLDGWREKRAVLNIRAACARDSLRDHAPLAACCIVCACLNTLYPEGGVDR